MDTDYSDNIIFFCNPDNLFIIRNEHYFKPRNISEFKELSLYHYVCKYVLHVFVFFLQLATEMLRLFDPTMEPQTAPPEETLNLIPIYRNPKIQGGVLPGND